MFLEYCLHQQKHNSAIRGIAPKVMTEGAACADLFSPYTFDIGAKEYATVDLLVSFKIPKDFCLYIQPRSSTFTKHGLMVPTGIVDCDYVGSVHLQVYNMDLFDTCITRGQRLVQVQFIPRYVIELREIEYQIESETRLAEIGSTGA